MIVIYVIALNLNHAKDQMTSYGYTEDEWKYVSNVNDICGCHGLHCVILDGASKRKGSKSECYRSLINKVREYGMTTHYWPELKLHKTRNKTEDKRNDLYCCW